MNNPHWNLETESADNQAPQSKVPEFGLLDVIEAFTAMRHESRGQRKETRELSESLNLAVASIRDLEAKLRAITAKQPDDAHKLIELVVEVDCQLTRIVESADRLAGLRESRADSEWETLQDAFGRLSGLARWFARPLWRVVAQIHDARTAPDEDSLLEGLKIILANLRRMMSHCELERLDVLAQPFNPETMNAVDGVAAADVPAGCVAEQISPAYRWQGKIVRFANVRIAQ